MEFYEINVILKSIHLSYKEGWEQTRMMSYVIAQSNSTKKIRPTDLILFPWDRTDTESGETSISTEDVVRLKKKAKQYIESK